MIWLARWIELLEHWRWIILWFLFILHFLICRRIHKWFISWHARTAHKGLICLLDRGLTNKAVWINGWTVDKLLQDALNVVLLVIEDWIICVHLLCCNFVLLVDEKVAYWISTLTRQEVAKWSCGIGDEFPLQDLAVYDWHECFTEVVAYLVEVLNLDLIFNINIYFLLLCPRVKAGIESRLNGVTIQYSKFFEHNYTASTTFLSFICKLAVREGKAFVLLIKKIRHYPDQIVVFVLVDFTLLDFTAIHKDISFSRVSMEITE